MNVNNFSDNGNSADNTNSSEQQKSSNRVKPAPPILVKKDVNVTSIPQEVSSKDKTPSLQNTPTKPVTRSTINKEVNNPQPRNTIDTPTSTITSSRLNTKSVMSNNSKINSSSLFQTEATSTVNNNSDSNLNKSKSRFKQELPSIYEPKQEQYLDIDGYDYKVVHLGPSRPGGLDRTQILSATGNLPEPVVVLRSMVTNSKGEVTPDKVKQALDESIF